MKRSSSHNAARGCTPPAKQAGAAALIVVMVLFFLVSLVAAYTSRNLVFEQRTSANQYRALQAQEAAEAGIDWALAMLNGGRIDSTCTEAGAAATDTTFRQRYLNIDASSGVISPVSTSLWPSCVSSGPGTWSCSCPASGAPTLSASSGSGVFPAFRLRFTTNGLSRPGLVRIESNGCTRLSDNCLNHPATEAELEGRANIAVVVALSSALPTPPGAALTVYGNAAGSVPASAFSVYNTDTGVGGLTVHASGIINAGGYTLRSVPGTPAAASIMGDDASLSELAAATDRAFASYFSMWPSTFRNQPAALRIDCPTTGCSNLLQTTAAMNPDRVIWVTGPNGLTLEAPATIGSAPGASTAAGPVVLVVDGPVNFTASGTLRIHGLLYTRSGNWQGTNAAEIQGAAVVEGHLADTARAVVVMNNAVLRSLRLRSGSFVRAPSGWDDFRERAP